MSDNNIRTCQMCRKPYCYKCATHEHREEFCSEECHDGWEELVDDEARRDSL